MLRAALNPLFSHKMELELEDVVQSKAQELYQLLTDMVVAGTALNLRHGLCAVSVNITIDYDLLGYTITLFLKWCIETREGSKRCGSYPW